MIENQPFYDGLSIMTSYAFILLCLWRAEGGFRAEWPRGRRGPSLCADENKRCVLK